MSAPKGNRFWEARTTHGRDKLFSTPDILWKAACEYFQWAEENPLEGEKLFSFQGEVIEGNFHKMRAMTLAGLWLFLDISDQTWYDYAKREDFIEVTKKIKSVIDSQKFAGAAADLLNANIIARDLGLSSDKVDLEIKEGGELSRVLSSIAGTTLTPGK